MNRLVLPLLLCGVWGLGAAGQPPGQPPGPPTRRPATNHLEILSDDGFEYLGHQAIYRGNVRASDGDMTLRCELLTVHFQTNQTNAAQAPKRDPALAGAHSGSARIASIVAEGKVVLTQQESRATGDHALYTATNELLVLTGAPAILETVQGGLEGTKVILDRRTGKLVAPGRTRMWLWPDAFGEQGLGLLGTNKLRLPGPSGPKGAATNAPPRR